MSEVAIAVENLGKQYLIGGSQQQFDHFGRQLAALVTSPFRRAARVVRGRPSGAQEVTVPFWALREASFQVSHGEIVGIIGRNGAGKSTLLKILSRITEPTEGLARIRGRVGSLLEVGTGLHPELTGRENVFLNGAILGMSKREILGRFDEIVDFAELEQFIDTPIKHYSSGMYVRLAFAVAAHLEPDIMLVDEVLAVGDVAFQKKSLGKMGEVARAGRTVLFVSHNMGLVEKLCDRGIYLNHGKVVADGEIRVTISSYLADMQKAQERPLSERDDRSGAGHARIESLTITNGPYSLLRTGQTTVVAIEVSRLLPQMNCLFVIYDEFGQKIAVLSTEDRAPEDIVGDFGRTFMCTIDELLLVPGKYFLNAMLLDGGGVQDFVRGAASFEVEAGQVRGRPVSRAKNQALVTLPCRWDIPK